MSLFLTKEELIELTGYRVPKKQIEWLQNEGLDHKVDAHKQPKVSRMYIEQAFGVKLNNSPVTQKKATEPNYEFLKRFTS